MKRGLVIGKFLPFHKGHEFLIETGKSQVDELTVLVCEHKDQDISGGIRASWIKECIPGVEVRVIPDVIAPDDSKSWAEYTLRILNYVPDVVFSSEEYGSAYARFMGCQHVMVDKSRSAVPISATKIRENPYANWDYLCPSVKAYFAKRVCIIGAESSGTTTIAKALADYYGTVWVNEYGREYWIDKMKKGYTDKWTTDEFVHIAREQNRQEDDAAKKCNKILFCDTDSFATYLWHERYMGFCSREVEEVNAGRKMDFYFLTDIDIPFDQDGTRDGEKMRNQMHLRFKEELQKREKSFLILSGSHEERMKKSIFQCNKLLGIK